MRLVGAVITTLVLTTMLATLPTTSRAQPCVTGTATVEVSTDAGFDGLYKYCVEVQWDLSQYALGHLDLYLELENCECVCDPKIVRFASPAGFTIGTENGTECVNEYDGEYACFGDPAIPEQILGAVVKWEPDESQCDAGTVGTGILCFYSPLPPREPTSYPDGLIIKHGQEICVGSIFGELPSCTCYVPTDLESWGQLKGFYR